MDCTALIFDLQRCSLRDGPGIRTTVFLKGCPLRCLWCHNPESQSPAPEISFNREKCADCLACVQACPHAAHQSPAGQHTMDHARCQVCGTCLPACPNDALQRVGDEWSVDRVLAEVERDRDYYDQSGGGLTLSGGEPMLQFDFTRALLRAAKERRIHTCLETCGFAPRQRYLDILADTDLFLFDYKETDPHRHRALTGVSNDLILSNLDTLLSAGAQVILRCPLAPGLNDSPSHLQGIASLSARYPQLRGIEIMAYHDMGADKALRIGRQPPLPHLKTVDETTKASWLTTLHTLGCPRITLG